MPYSDLVTQKEAAAILNRSVSSVSRAIKDDRLEYADPKNRLLHRLGIEIHIARKTRPRIDKPQRKTQTVPANWGEVPPEGREIETSYWPRLLQKLTSVMDGAPVYWSREPNAHQLMLFCRTIDELRQQCELEGFKP